MEPIAPYLKSWAWCPVVEGQGHVPSTSRLDFHGLHLLPPVILSKYRLTATAERCTLLAPLKHEDSLVADVLDRLTQR